MTGQMEIDKKKNGVYYTPSSVAKILCRWAIQQQDDLVLEPSFGGCQFLDAAISRLRELGECQPSNLLFGADIDPQAFSYLKNIIPENQWNNHFTEKDFLTLDAKTFSQRAFDVIIGNPPYVSHHNMSEVQTESATQTIKKSGYNLSRKASLWAYFVLHSLSFLKGNGRMAWILPSSFLYADYAQAIRETLKNGFSRVLVIQLQERLFLTEGTEEISTVVLCDGWQNTTQESTYDICFIESSEDLSNLVKEWGKGKSVGTSYEKRSRLSLLDQETTAFYQVLAEHSYSKTLSELCDIQIGIVSGANEYFILNKDEVKSYNLPLQELTPILTRYKYIRGMIFSSDNMQRIQENGKDSFLVDTSKVETIDSNLDQYLNSFKDKVENRTTFKRRSKRGDWHRFNDNRIPDAFFPYMLSCEPVLVLNEAQVNSTNSIHRVYFNNDIGIPERKRIALSLLSSFSQLSAEIEGRTYGAGVLKHEPSEALRIKLLLPPHGKDDSIAFEKAHQALVNRNVNGARNIADHFALSFYPPKERKKFIELLQEALKLVRLQRFPKKPS